jgi:hypothetical protein
MYKKFSIYKLFHIILAYENRKSVTWSNEEPTLIGYSSYVDRIFADAAVQTDELRSGSPFLLILLSSVNENL